MLVIAAESIIRECKLLTIAESPTVGNAHETHCFFLSDSLAIRHGENKTSVLNSLVTNYYGMPFMEKEIEGYNTKFRLKCRKEKSMEDLP